MNRDIAELLTKLYEENPAWVHLDPITIKTAVQVAKLETLARKARLPANAIRSADTKRRAELYLRVHGGNDDPFNEKIN
jgi:hypothetical protein